MARVVPVSWRDIGTHLRLLAESINGILDGRQNNTGTVTLTASTTTTQVVDRRVGVDSVITFMPETANAAAEVGNGTMYVATVTAESFTITHANNAQTDRAFRYEVTG